MNYALFVEYEGILLGNTQKFSQLSLTRLREKTTAKQILRFIFEELLEWTPEQVRDYLTPQIAEQLHLTRIVHQIDFPSECNPETDLFYLAAFVYPEQIRISKRKQVLFVYEKYYRENSKNFPKIFLIWRRRIQFGNLPCLCVKSLWKLSFSGRTVWFFRRQTQILPFCQRTQVNRAYS